MSEQIKSGFGNLVWVRDKDGKQYACSANALKDKKSLTEKDKVNCIDVSTIVGTERW